MMSLIMFCQRFSIEKTLKKVKKNCGELKNLDLKKKRGTYLYFLRYLVILMNYFLSSKYKLI